MFHCVLIDSPEALNMIKEEHIMTIISLIDRHGRDPKVRFRSTPTIDMELLIIIESYCHSIQRDVVIH